MLNILTTIFSNNITWVVIWVIVFAIALTVEFSTEQLISIWFAGAAVIAIILAACSVVWWVQLVVFTCLSGILLACSRLIFKPKKDIDVPTNSDQMIGKEIIVTKDVTPLEKGEGKFRDVTWSVALSSEDQEPIKAGEIALIKDIVGNHLIIERKK